MAMRFKWHCSQALGCALMIPLGDGYIGYLNEEADASLGWCSGWKPVQHALSLIPRHDYTKATGS
jgi:hypothetical protein